MRSSYRFCRVAYHFARAIKTIKFCRPLERSDEPDAPASGHTLNVSDERFQHRGNRKKAHLAAPNNHVARNASGVGPDEAADASGAVDIKPAPG
jgi:hypothetical protein